MRKLLFAISLLMAAPGFAQETDPYSVGTCSQASGDAYVETSRLRARIINNGALFWRGNPHVFEVPNGSGVQAMFIDNLIVGGWVDSDLRVAGSLYGPFEFWPGPLPDDGSAPVDCGSFDRLWTLSLQADLNDDLWADAPPDHVLDWPAHLGAPFKDMDGHPGYDPAQGDRPLIRGDQSVWWVMNDRGNSHGRFGSKPLGLEVRGSVWAFDTAGWIGTTLFMRHEITNRGNQIIQDAFLSRLTDSELGFLGDDTWSTDTTHSALLFYNADNHDDLDRGGYGDNPPALGLVFLDIEHSSAELSFDMVNGRPRYFSATSSFIGSASRINGDPDSPQAWYNYAQGLWRQGQTMVEWGNGEPHRSIPYPPTKFWMPGDPVSGALWSPTNYSGVPFPAKNFGGDQRAMASFGPFDLAPNETITLTTAYVWRRGADFLDSVTQVREAAAELLDSKQALTSLRGFPETVFEDGNPSETPQYPFWVDEPWPNPTTGQISVLMSLKWDAPVTIMVLDMLGRELWRETFEGLKGPVTQSLDLEGLPPGTYLIRVTQRGTSTDQRVVVL